MPLTDLFGTPLQPIDQQSEIGDLTSDYSVEVLAVGEVDDASTPKRSFNGLVFWLLGVVIILGIQCFRLQITDGPTYQSKAVQNSLRIVKIEPDRGLITDVSGKPLAQNTQRLALAINPETLPTKKAARLILYAQLQQKAGIDTATINFIEKNRTATPDIYPIKTDLSQDESLLYTEWFANTPGIVLQEVPIRQYANLPSLGQLVGYVGQANLSGDKLSGYTPDQRIGKAGLESTYNTQLMGSSGTEEAEVDASGKIIRQIASTGSSASKTGQTLRLSLDSTLQQNLGASLAQAMQQRTQIYGDITKNLGASAVVLDPHTGAIKAMLSLPDYNSNLFAGGITQGDYEQLIKDPTNPLLNRAIQGRYPAGSTVKPLIAAAALEAGIIDSNKVINTPEAIYVGQFRFPDWKFHGSSDMRQAIAQSNDIYFYAIGGGYAPDGVSGLGIDRLNAGLDAFGLATKTGVDLPGEVAGLTPGPDWKKKNVGQSWYIGDTYHQSIGQGYLLVTPLQMAAAVAAIANGGTLYQPQLAWSLTDPVSNSEIFLPHPIIRSNWISSNNITIIQQGMAQTTQPGGTAQLVGKLNVTSAAKTGTAQFGTNNLTHSWYIGYAPLENPQIAWAVLIEGDGDVSEATEGSEIVVEQMLRQYFNEPLQPGQQLNTAPLLPKAATTPTPVP